MESVTVVIPGTRIVQALEKAAEEMFKTSYNNPMVDLLKKSIEEKEGEIKKIVNEIIVEAIGKPEFKSKIADVVIQRMVAGALNK